MIPLSPGPHAPLCMYEGHFDYEGPLDTDIPLDDGDSLWAGSGSDNSLLNPDNWLQDDDGVWRLFSPPIMGASALNFGLRYTCSALCPSGSAVLIRLPSLLRPRIWCGATLWGCSTAQSVSFPLMRTAPSMCHRRCRLHWWRQDLPLLDLLGRAVAVQRGIPRPLNGGSNAADSWRLELA
jgi:hypothetical protein